jgi:hypothetical protein
MFFIVQLQLSLLVKAATLNAVVSQNKTQSFKLRIQANFSGIAAMSHIPVKTVSLTPFN